MKPGDLVRFRAPHWLGGAGASEEDRPWLLGLLVEYHKWEKIASILYNDEILRIGSRNVQKFGRRYLECG
jgi:hypothetical protein